MIFGKEENENEDLCKTISEILEDVNEKPRLIEFRRVGSAKPGKSRPIKVKLSSSDAAMHALQESQDFEVQ